MRHDERGESVQRAANRHAKIMKDRQILKIDQKKESPGKRTA
jgi:hypothetical protein